VLAVVAMVAATVGPALLAVAMAAAVVAALVVVRRRLVAAMAHVAAVPVVVVAKVAAHAPVARPLHAAAPVAAVVVAMKAAIATMIRNLHAPTPTWARTWATPIQATAAPAIRAVASPTRCAPAWTAWAAVDAVAVVVIVAAMVEEAAMVVDQARVAVVAGATGLVGRAVLAALLTAEPDNPGDGAALAAQAAPVASPHLRSDNQGASVVHVLHARDRRAPALNHPCLQLHAVDFANLPALPPVDDVYITLGTTIAAAGSQSAFRAVDYDAVLATARAALAAGASRCGVVTAMGANPHSHIFYNRIKGEVERDLQGLGFTTLVIARPSLMLGERQALQQAARPAESLSIQIFKWLDPIIPANYRARPGADIARALVHAVQSRSPGLHLLSGRELQAP